MNNIFSFDRFVKVLKYDLKMRVPAVFASFLAFLAIPHALHIVMSFGQTFPVAQRVDLYFTMAAFLMFFAPFTIYSSFNNKQGKSGFLMLPASALEKFTSMVAVSKGMFSACIFASKFCHFWTVGAIEISSVQPEKSACLRCSISGKRWAFCTKKRRNLLGFTLQSKSYICH